MAELKRAGNKMEDQGIPRAALSEGVLTIDVDSHVETMEEQEDARWHQLLNAHRTKKILTGQLGGIERLDSGWVVAITYYNGFRILIPMDEMMINLMGDGRENSDTLNRQTRIANNMLGSDIDFIIRDLDEQSRSVVASRKDAMLKKRQMFYLNENEEEKPMLYLYVCDGYPDDCDAYVGAHKKSLLPKGELADGQLRNKRILAHRALNTLLKEGGMTRKSAYIWLQNKLCLQKKDMHIAKFSLYYCEETIRVCNELIEWHQKRKGE